MPTLVRFRFNKRTGEVEEFIVDDQSRRLPEREHDRIARAVASVVALDPRITEVMPEFVAASARSAVATSEGEVESERDTREERRRE
jgi:hypothetical protein